MRTEVGSGGEQLLACKDNILADNGKLPGKALPKAYSGVSNRCICKG